MTRVQFVVKNLRKETKKVFKREVSKGSKGNFGIWIHITSTNMLVLVVG